MFSQFQITTVVLFAFLQDVIPQLILIGSLTRNREAPLTHAANSHTFPWTNSSTSPPLQYATKPLGNVDEEVSGTAESPSVVGHGSRQRSRRDVPLSSYGRSGSDDGVEVYIPASEEQVTTDKSGPSEETFDKDGSTSRNLQTHNAIPSNVSDYQKPLPSGEQGKLMQGLYFTALDGSTINTSWTADEKGFHIQGPKISVSGLGFGRRR